MTGEFDSVISSAKQVEQELENAGYLQDFYSPLQKERVVVGVMRVRELGRSGAELSEEQLAALERGPGLVRNPAPQLSRAEIFARSHSLNNYEVYFKENHGPFAEYYCQTPAFQRFLIIYPELSDYLFSISKEEQNPLVLRAIIDESYDLMRQLVDIGDAHVIVDGAIRSSALCT